MANKFGLERAVKNALCQVRHEQDISNKELFETLLHAIPDFMANQRPDQRTKEGKAQLAIANQLHEIAEKIAPFMN